MDTLRRSFGVSLEEPVRQHLKNVYGTVTLSSLTAGAGAYISVKYGLAFGGLLTSLAAMGMLFGVLGTPDSDKDRSKRLGFLLGFAFLSGLGMDSLLQLALFLNPSIVITALITTFVVFMSFTLAAITARRGQYLYLGGTLLSILTVLSVLSLANIFIGSKLLFDAYLYIGLFVMCGFVVYDTQAIIEKRRSGDKDYIRHSIDLFMDLLSIFRHLMVILLQKECDNSRKSKKKN